MFVLLGFVLSVLMQVIDKKLIASEVAKELKGVVSDREFLEAYSAAVSSTIETIHASSGMNSQELERARKQVLRGIRAIVDYYYDKSDDFRINACYMLAYPTTRMPPGVEKRLQFKQKTRPIANYAYVLDLVMWAEDRSDLPKELAIPVEDPSDDETRLGLLPGAPQAFAMGEIVVVQDTHNLGNYFRDQGRYVDPKVKEDQLQFFTRYNFRSFACFPLEHEGSKKGVLTIQSNEPHIFGKNNQHQKLVSDLLKPMRDSLTILI